jgi:hypothetical protein
MSAPSTRTTTAQFLIDRGIDATIHDYRWDATAEGGRAMPSAHFVSLIPMDPQARRSQWLRLLPVLDHPQRKVPSTVDTGEQLEHGRARDCIGCEGSLRK